MITAMATEMIGVSYLAYQMQNVSSACRPGPGRSTKQTFNMRRAVLWIMPPRDLFEDGDVSRWQLRRVITPGQ